MAKNKKIVAIMFTSLVDYSKLAKKDSKLALELLSEHDKILSVIIAKFDGRIIKHINDSIFAEFQSATESVNCALSIQKKIQQVNEINPKDFQIHVGIGLHMAEVHEEDGDLFGDGINLAARIKSLSHKHDILTTQAIYNSIRSEKNIFIRDIGRVVLKNIQDPERVFKIYLNKTHHTSETLDILITNMKSRGIQFFDYQETQSTNLSICMHYIHNLGDANDEFLCFGITDFVNLELNKIDNIETPNVKSIMKFKELDNINEIGKALNVDYLIKGSLMKMDNKIRLTLRMVNTINSNELWVKDWEDSIDVLNNIKNQIVIQTLDALGLEIPKKFETQSTKNDINPDAYKYMMQGKFTALKAKNSTDFELARSFYKKAFECQPNYIAAKVFYARHSFDLRKYDEGIAILKEAEEEGIKNKNNRDLVHVYQNFGLVYKQLGKYDKAVDYLKEGLRLMSLDDDSRTEQENLNQEAALLNTLGQCYTQTTKPRKAIDNFKRCIQIRRSQDNPIALANGLVNLALAHKKMGDYAKALSLNKESIEIFRSNNIKMQLGITTLNYANLLYYIGHEDKARRYYLESLALGKEFNALPLIGMVYRALGLLELNKNNTDQAIEYLLKANKIHKDAKHQIAIELTTTLLAQAYEQHNDFKNASKYIEKAVLLTNRRKHEDTSNSFSEYYTLPSRCVKALIDVQLKNDNKLELDNLFNEIITLHKDKQKSRELWWLAKSYFILGFLKEAKKCQELSQKDLKQKANLIRDKLIKKDYLELPPLHKEIFTPIKELFAKKTKKETNTLKLESNLFKFCVECGFNNENLFQFCPECGTAFFCSNCKKEK